MELELSQVSPIGVGIIVTTLFLVLGVLSKALANSDLCLDDFHLGMEASLTSLSGAGVYGFELFKQATDLPKVSPEFAAIYDAQTLNYCWLFVSLMALFGTATTHMLWGKCAAKPVRRFLALQAANIFGLATLFGFIYFVKHGV